MSRHAVQSQFAGEPHGRQSDDRADAHPFGGNPRFPFIRQDKLRLGAETKGEFRADGAPPFVRVNGSLRPHAQSDSFALRKSRANQVVGFLREAPWVTPLSGDSFGTFLSTRREKYKEKLTAKLKFENPHVPRIGENI